MPIYEFRCGSGHVHELALSMDSADREAARPECAAPATRLISAVDDGASDLTFSDDEVMHEDLQYVSTALGCRDSAQWRGV